MASLSAETGAALQLPPVPEDKERFYIELEFVQNLSNLHYLNFLSTKKFLDDPQFLAFLEYLQYWKSPQYVKYIMFPQCLVFLDELISNESFRRELSLPMFVNYAAQQQHLMWMKGGCDASGNAAAAADGEGGSKVENK